MRMLAVSRRVLLAAFVSAIAVSSAAGAAGPGAEKPGSAERAAGPELPGGWHFVRTRNPQGGADAISIMHTADTSRSDLDLAGLTIRCGDNRPEAVIVLIRAFPLRARPRIVLGKPGNETQLEATVAAPGTALLLPRDAISLVNGSWQGLNELPIRIDTGKNPIRGVVELAGLQTAFKVLLASCGRQ